MSVRVRELVSRFKIRINTDLSPASEENRTLPEKNRRGDKHHTQLRRWSSFPLTWQKKERKKKSQKNAARPCSPAFPLTLPPHAARALLRFSRPHLFTLLHQRRNSFPCLLAPGTVRTITPPEPLVVVVMFILFTRAFCRGSRAIIKNE